MALELSTRRSRMPCLSTRSVPTALHCMPTSVSSFLTEKGLVMDNDGLRFNHVSWSSGIAAFTFYSVWVYAFLFLFFQ